MGGEEGLRDIRASLPIGTRFIPWGHRLSFAYLGSGIEIGKNESQKLAHDVLKYRQEACSAPQLLYVEGDWERAKLVSEKMYEALCKAVECEFPHYQDVRLDLQRQAEITNFTLLKKVEEALGQSRVYGSQETASRVIAIKNNELVGSPLENTLIVKPIERSKIKSVLRPMRSFLQTTGLLAQRDDVQALSELFFAAGVTRITSWGEMQESYLGEPHDGERALTRFLKRVRVGAPELSNLTKWSEGNVHTFRSDESQKIMTKSDFATSMSISSEHRFVFKSGGSSGVQAISPFSYDDYHRQMQFAADGLLAAGLSPKSDRVMNLFFGGSLYGGFLSFSDILEKVDALQFPMSAVSDLKLVVASIEQFNINTLMGMPSYLYSLFNENQDFFKGYRGIKKIFYGGEFISKTVREWYRAEFGVELIKSASYGSVDAGPVAYQCAHLEGGHHHLHHGLHKLEILKLDRDEPVADGETGRLIYSTPSRLSTRVVRYELGDIGRWVEGKCPCGHASARFELQGRIGDIFRAGGSFINFQKMEKILLDKCDYSKALQLEISKRNGLDHLMLVTEEVDMGPNVRELLLELMGDLRVAVSEEKCVSLEVVKANIKDFKISQHSGKLLRVIDQRRHE